MREFNKQVNATATPPHTTRTRPGPSIRRSSSAFEIFGGGVNAFSRYENGKTKPPVAPVKLLRLLEQYPELLDEIRPGAHAA